VEIRKSEFNLSEDDGITVFDTGFHLSGCKLKDNKGNGVFLSQKIPHNQQLISGSIKDYLSRSPMCVMISECEFSKNYKDGFLLRDFWKGSVVFSKTIVEENFGVGIHVLNTYLPMQQEN